DSARFDASIAGPLVEFFAKALARSVDDRFGSATEMLSAWERCFAEPQTSPARSATTDYSLLTGDSPLSELRLSKKVASTLDRAGVFTVSDLLEINPVGLNRMRGVGKVTVGEIRQLIAD